jgi:hypothetical protein
MVIPLPMDQAEKEIKAYIDKRRKPYSSWYVGIASDARKRLFEEHNVSEKDDYWTYRRCSSVGAARVVEEALLKLGCDGALGGGDESTASVYAYLKSANTNP